MIWGLCIEGQYFDVWISKIAPKEVKSGPNSCFVYRSSYVVKDPDQMCTIAMVQKMHTRLQKSVHVVNESKFSFAASRCRFPGAKGAKFGRSRACTVSFFFPESAGKDEKCWKKVRKKIAPFRRHPR